MTGPLAEPCGSGRRRARRGLRGWQHAGPGPAQGQTSQAAPVVGEGTLAQALAEPGGTHPPRAQPQPQPQPLTPGCGDSAVPDPATQSQVVARDPVCRPSQGARSGPELPPHPTPGLLWCWDSPRPLPTPETAQGGPGSAPGRRRFSSGAQLIGPRPRPPMAGAGPPGPVVTEHGAFVPAAPAEPSQKPGACLLADRSFLLLRGGAGRGRQDLGASPGTDALGFSIWLPCTDDSEARGPGFSEARGPTRAGGVQRAWPEAPGFGPRQQWEGSWAVPEPAGLCTASSDPLRCAAL